MPGHAAAPQLRAATYARLGETYDAAEPVPTQLASADRHARRRGWRVVARFQDDGYSAFTEIRRDGFARLIEAIERDEIDGAQAGGDPRLAGGDGLAVAPAVRALGQAAAGPLDLAEVGFSLVGVRGDGEQGDVGGGGYLEFGR